MMGYYLNVQFQGLKLKDDERDRKAFLEYLIQKIKTLTSRNVGAAQQSTRLYFLFSVSLCKQAYM